MGERDKGFMVGGMKFGVGEEDGPAEEVEGPLLPLRILAITSLVPDADHNGGASAPENVTRVDLQNPDELFAKLRPRASIEVPSVLHQGKPFRIEFAPTSMKSFRPDGLVAEVKLLRSLLDGRAVLERVAQGEITPTQAQGQLDRLWEGSPFVAEVLGLAPTAAPAPVFTPPAAPLTSDSTGSSILDLVDMGGPDGGGGGSGDASSPAPAADPDLSQKLSKIISQVALSGRKGGGARPSDAVPRVDQAIGAQLGAILQHPQVRRLERAYRGLRFLVERSQRIPGVLLDVISLPSGGESSAAAVFASAAKRASDVPYSFAIVDTDIDGSARSFTDLLAIGETAESYVIPALVNGDEPLLGVGDLGNIERLDNKQGLFTAPHRAPWRSVANKTSMRWVALCMNGVLARSAYDKNSSRVREAIVKETPDDHESVVWMSPIWAVASLIVQSFKDTGWPGRIVGPRNGMVENLPVREIDQGGEVVAVPTQAYLSTDSQREMARMGVLLLASAPNSDAVYLHAAPTAYVTPEKKTYDSASTEPEERLPPISLVDKLFIARLVQFARALCSKIPPDSAPHEVEEVLKGALWALFDKAPPAGPQLSVNVKRTADGSMATIGVEPRRFLGVSLEEFAFEMPIG